MTKLTPFTMPKWGIEMTEGTIAEWMVAENAPYTKGTILTLIETDKITNEVEAESDARLVRIIAKAGETYPVGALLAIMADGEAEAAKIDEIIARFHPVDAPEQAENAPPPPAKSPETTPKNPEKPRDSSKISPSAWQKAQESTLNIDTLPGSGKNGRLTAQDIEQALRAPAKPALTGPYPSTPDSPAWATPIARRLAHIHDIALESIAGSGARGRIRAADVLAVLPASGPAILPMSSMRRTIARRLTEAKANIPHFYVRRRVRADRLLAQRTEIKGKKPSINDYLIKACALALIEVPEVNIQVHGTDIHRFSQADVAVAVATEKGLVTPIVTSANTRSIFEIAEIMQDLATRARTGKLALEEFSGGSFSLSNLGSFGVEQFDAIINPPQGAILAIGTARPEPIEDTGAIRIVPVLHLSLSADHRAIDGADAGRFMAALARLLESPNLLI